MEQFKCPDCGELQETLVLEYEVIGETLMVPQDNIDDLIEAASVYVEASCEFCSYSGAPENFIVVDELTEEEKNELESRPVEGQIILRFPSDFED